MTSEPFASSILNKPSPRDDSFQMDFSLAYPSPNDALQDDSMIHADDA
jgi:hypothetical protein